MSGESNLSELLAAMAPEMQAERYVFARADELPSAIEPTAMVREEEGITLVLPQEIADRHVLEYDHVAAMITLRVHSSLDAVGLTAAVTSRLARAGMSCNVLAGYYHDHLFVPAERGHEAVELLTSVGQERLGG
ncbi:ACT domain-containing protein [Haloactinomyces albus]|uniref:Uncharacterized protein n=1 Tax=Haloactinomyces albus TaxID=1352928 RepID=A0AAE3ZFI9_9ACTN|nr:ACT domain-containing protein [Haloactinomyces albus]MDR7304026.1 hypothetical protein [Haloactinomyces albus]